MAIQDDNTILMKSDLKAYHEAIAPMLGGSFMLNTNVSDYYSTDEKIVGVWLDGKPLYQKTITGAVVGSFNTGITNGSNAFIVSGYMVEDRNDEPALPLNFYYNNTIHSLCDIKADASYIWMITAGLNIRRFAITIQYTKTTDTANSAATTPGCYDINFPNTWPENKEIFFGNGLYGYRAVGTANVTANRRWDLVIARDQPNAKIRSQGGGFTTHSNWFCPTPWHYESDGTFQCSTSMFVGNVENTKNVNYYIMSSSNGSLPYDVWVTYTK